MMVMTLQEVLLGIITAIVLVAAENNIDDGHNCYLNLSWQLGKCVRKKKLCLINLVVRHGTAHVEVIYNSLGPFKKYLLFSL